MSAPTSSEISMIDAAKQGKRCTVCLQTKPLNEFYRSKTNKDGLCGNCKNCFNLNSKRKREERNKNKVKVYKNKTELRNGVLGKVCFKCGAFKATTEFLKSARNHSGFSGSCKECLKDEKKRTHHKNYVKNKDVLNKKVRDYKRSNYETITLKRRQKKAEQTKELAPQYVEKLLRLPKKVITRELVTLKTQALQVTRLRKQISTSLKESKS